MISNYILIAINRYRKTNRIFESCTTALIVWTLHIYAWSLILSSFNALGYWQIATLYVLSNAYMVIRLLKANSHIFSDTISKTREYLKKQIDYIRQDRTDTVLTLFIICFVVGLGIVACIAVPYNYDSIDYHAPRICQWVQNKSVFYYASHVTRQNFSTILAAYVSTFAYILTFGMTGSMCIIQYGAYVINLMLILHLCRYFGVGRRLRKAAAILWITLPIGFAEAITPQNDQCAALWLLLFVIYLIRLIDRLESLNAKEKLLEIVVLAICIALAYLTKPSVCFAMLVFLFWYLCVCIKCKTSFRSILMQCVSAGSIILFLICPQMIQNYLILGKVAADNVGKYQLIGTLRPDYMFINMLKNLFFNLVYKIGPFTNEKLLVGLIGKIADVLRVEIDHHDISEGGLPFGFPSLPCYTCDAGLNFTIFFLSLLALVIFVFYLIKRKNKRTSVDSYIICTYLSFLLLCFFLRWERSITRYMIGYFALLIVAVVVIFSRVLNGYISPQKKTNVFLIFVTVMFSLMVMTDVCFELYDLIRLHPVFPQKSALTLYNYQLNDYEEVCQHINDLEISELGLIEGECPAEFAIWQMLNDGIVIRHVNLETDNPFIILEERELVPDAVLSRNDDRENIECHGNEYSREYLNATWSLYIRKNG